MSSTFGKEKISGLLNPLFWLLCELDGFNYYFGGFFLKLETLIVVIIFLGVQCYGQMSSYLYKNDFYLYL